jgi:hypothetical protein
MPKHLNKRAAAVAGMVALAVGGSAIATAATSKKAASSSAKAVKVVKVAKATPAATTTTSSMPAHGLAAHENAEAAVTGSAATQAQAAAVKSVGSGTAGAVTRDFDGTGYEVTITKSDGSTVEVHLDSTFAVQAGHGGGHGGDGDGDGPATTTATITG